MASEQVFDEVRLAQSTVDPESLDSGLLPCVHCSIRGDLGTDIYGRISQISIDFILIRNVSVVILSGKLAASPIHYLAVHGNISRLKWEL